MEVSHAKRGEIGLCPHQVHVHLQHNPDCFHNPLQVSKSKKRKNAKTFSQSSPMKTFLGSQGINIRKDQRASASVT